MSSALFTHPTIDSFINSRFELNACGRDIFDYTAILLVYHYLTEKRVASGWCGNTKGRTDSTERWAEIEINELILLKVDRLDMMNVYAIVCTYILVAIAYGSS